jgi:hypothetical protein
MKNSLSYGVLGVVALCMCGLLYFRHLENEARNGLAREALDRVKNEAPVLLKGLGKSQAAASGEEVEALGRISKDNRIVFLAYFNRYGETRWFGEPALVGKPFDTFAQSFPLPTDAFEQSYVAKAPKVRPIPGGGRIDIAYPLVFQNEVKGTLDMHVFSQETSKAVAAGMKRFWLAGAALLALFVGISTRIPGSTIKTRAVPFALLLCAVWLLLEFLMSILLAGRGDGLASWDSRMWIDWVFLLTQACLCLCLGGMARAYYSAAETFPVWMRWFRRAAWAYCAAFAVKICLPFCQGFVAAADGETFMGYSLMRAGMDFLPVFVVCLLVLDLLSECLVLRDETKLTV